MFLNFLPRGGFLWTPGLALAGSIPGSRRVHVGHARLQWGSALWDRWAGTGPVCPQWPAPGHLGFGVLVTVNHVSVP